MPKASHSQTRVAHRGPRHTSDPDRRVKYALRFRRKGDELEAQTTVVRRHRRSEEKELAPRARRLFDRQARRRARQETREQLESERRAYNMAGVAEVDAPTA